MLKNSSFAVAVVLAGVLWTGLADAAVRQHAHQRHHRPVSPNRSNRPSLLKIGVPTEYLLGKCLKVECGRPAGSGVFVTLTAPFDLGTLTNTKYIVTLSNGQPPQAPAPGDPILPEYHCDQSDKNNLDIDVENILQKSYFTVITLKIDDANWTFIQDGTAITTPENGDRNIFRIAFPSADPSTATFIVFANQRNKDSCSKFSVGIVSRSGTTKIRIDPKVKNGGYE